MKTFPLSTKGERAAGILFSILFTACMGLLVFVLRNNITMLIVSLLTSVLLVVLLGFYVVMVTKAVCVYHPEERTLEIKGYPGQTIDLTKTTLLQTLPRKSGHAIVRILVFTDAEGEIVATVPTYFTHRQGVLAEPMAMEMANELGLEFKANVPVWEYDEEERKKHDEEMARQAKEDRKKRRQDRINYRINKRRNQK